MANTVRALSAISILLFMSAFLSSNSAFAQDGQEWLAKSDRGIFPELNRKVRLSTPTWIKPDVILKRGTQRIGYFQGVPVSVETDDDGEQIEYAGLHNDLDGDGIPNQLDIVLGARKTVLNRARYEGGYERLAFPMGDVSRDKGVCTDVVIRALRNAGLDLQEALNKDIRASPRSYPMVNKRNPHIDQRRVKTLLPYFKRKWKALPTSPQEGHWLPGDIVFMDTLPKPGPDHIGIVSDRIGESGYPMVVNNWTDGYHTSDMDLLGSIPITHRFRIPPSRPKLSASSKGLQGLLSRTGMSVPRDTTQVLVVTTPNWGAASGQLRRYERRGNKWAQRGSPIAIHLGARGLGWGQGLHKRADEKVKREGDQKSPAGMFKLGTAFGPEPKSPVRGGWPWRQAGPDDVWVDDPKSSHYNTWQKRGGGDWDSAERLQAYRMGIVVEHNTHPVKPGLGSAIFLHLGESPTPGCTVMNKKNMRRVLSWLSPEKNPVLLQVVGTVLE